MNSCCIGLSLWCIMLAFVAGTIKMDKLSKDLKAAYSSFEGVSLTACCSYICFIQPPLKHARPMLDFGSEECFRPLCIVTILLTLYIKYLLYFRYMLLKKGNRPFELLFFLLRLQSLALLPFMAAYLLLIRR